MYQAMGVDNVDAILKPDPEQPEPTGPATGEFNGDEREGSKGVSVPGPFSAHTGTF